MIIIMQLLLCNLFAQPVIHSQKVIGGSSYEEFRSMCPTKDGGLIVAGYSYSNKSGEKTQNIRGESDYWVVKLDKNHNVEWDKTLGGNWGEFMKSVIQTSDGGFAIVGESTSYISVEKDEDSRGSSDIWFVKLDRHGNLEWNKTLGGTGTEYVDNVVQTPDGGYILVGSSDSYRSFEKSEDSRGVFDYWVVKLDKKGSVIWDRTLGGNDYEFGSPVELTSDGGVLVGGFSQSNISGEKTENSRGSYDYWIVKLDMNGNKLWDKTIGGADGDYCRGIKQTSDGGYVLNGHSLSNISGEKTDNSRGGFDHWIIKIDKTGQVVMDKTIGGDRDDNDVWNLEKTSDGGYIYGSASASNISGEKTESSRGDVDYWVVKLDASLNIQWDKTIGGAGYDALYLVKEVAKNLYAVGGVSWSEISGDKDQPSRGLADYWIVWLTDKKNDVKNAGAEQVQYSSNRNISGAPEPGEKVFAVYPNPAKSVLNVHVNGKALVTITDQSGKTMLSTQVENNGSINVSSFPKGIYYVRDNQTSLTHKIFVTK
jgi:hypothetical protein